LLVLPKGNKSEVALARRLQPETTMKLKMDSAKTARGNWTYVSNLLRKTKSANSEDLRCLRSLATCDDLQISAVNVQ